MTCVRIVQRFSSGKLELSDSRMANYQQYIASTAYCSTTLRVSTKVPRRTSSV